MTKAPFLTREALTCSMCAHHLTVVDDTYGVTVKLCMHPKRQKLLKDQKPCRNFVLIFPEGRDEE